LTEAIILLIIDPRIESALLDEVKTYPGVTDAHYLYGPYDMYIKITADSDEGIHNLVLDKIRRLYGVKSTVTMVIAKN
jgi:DNA-binding Lrp family transcriptional regulator